VQLKQQISMATPRPIAVSLKSRGLIAYEHRAGELKDYVNNAFLDVSDISIAIVTDVSQTQLTAKMPTSFNGE